MKIIMMLAQTADGKIAKHDKHNPDWTSKEDKQLFANITKETGVVIMGDKTFYAMPRALPGRLNVVFTLEEKPPETEGVMWVTGEIEPVLEKLKSKGYTQAVLGGGAFLNNQFLKKKLVDEILLTIEPKLFGQGISILSDEFDIDLKLIEHIKLNDSAFAVRYKVLY
jgi:dihydrofolate reductase